MPLITLSTEVLPAPLGPMIDRISPGWTAKPTPRRARRPPNSSDTSITRRIGSEAADTPMAPRLPTTNRTLADQFDRLVGRDHRRVAVVDLGQRRRVHL